MKTWGKSVHIDGAGCNEDIKNKEKIAEFITQLAKDIDMVAWGEPHIVHFGSGNKAGWTAVQLIETSNITAHFNEVDSEVYLDVFSCKDFDSNIVLKCLESFFGVTSVMVSVLERQAQISFDNMLKN